MLRKFLGVFLILLLPLSSLGDEKSKKAYELIYQDVQLLKQKLLELKEKIEADEEDIRLIKNQLKELLAQIKLFQTEQASFRGELKNIPSQYQFLLEKLELINLELIKISENLLVTKSASPLASGEEQKSTVKEGPTSVKKRQEQEKKELKTEERTQPSPPPSLSPTEVFNMANSDYLKGNFELAIEGFKIYREQFPDSPLTDNALYWIGECYFSLRKFEQAIGEFNELILNYPYGDKIAAAYLKKGISLIELGKKEEALSVFKLLISKYPLEEETKIAQEKIKDLISKK